MLLESCITRRGDEISLDPGGRLHHCNGHTNVDGSVPSSPEVLKSEHYACPGQVSFDERNYKLTTLVVESLECFGGSGIDIVD